MVFSVFLSSPSQADKKLEENKPEIKTIIVTANKHSQSVQHVPIAISTLSTSDLLDFQIVSADQVAQFISNVNTTRAPGGMTNIFIRGVGMDDFNLSAVPAVGVYLDDIAISNPMATAFALFDVERVEVMRGPQNTLFGKNTTGGAINYISAKPDLSAEVPQGYARLTTGSYNQILAEAATGFKITNKSAIRLSAFNHQRDGLAVSRVEGNQSNFQNIDRQGFRLQLLNETSEDWQLEFNLHGGQQKQISEVRSVLFSTMEDQPLDPEVGDIFSNDSQLINPPNDIDTSGGSFKLTQHWPKFTLTSISSYEQVESRRMDDWGAQNQPTGVSAVTTYNSTDTHNFSQELQLISLPGSEFDWVAGVLYLNDSGRLLQAAFIDPVGLGRPDDAVNDAGSGPLFDRAGLVNIDTRSYSFYGQIEYPLTQAIKLTGGYRWTREKFEPVIKAAGMMMDLLGQEFPLGSFGWYSLGNPDFDIHQDYAGFDTIHNFFEANGGAPATAAIKREFTEWGGKLALSYTFDKNMMGYVSVSRGFKMSAVNSNPSSLAFASLLDKVVIPETLTTYELGFKTDWFNNQLRLNGAIFQNYWDNYQYFLVSNPGAPQLLLATLVNVPAAESHGAELELNWLPSDSTFIKAGLGILSGEITNSAIDLSGVPESNRDDYAAQIADGDKLTNAPALSYHVIVGKL